MRIVAFCLGILSAVSLAAQSSAAYRITRNYVLGGEGSWDYIVPDPPNHRLFIGRQNRVMVVDENAGTVLGEVTGIDGAHGTAIAAPSGHGFATSGRDRSVVMFDLKTFKTLARIPAAEDADAIIYDPPSNRVFTFNGDAHSSTVIDPAGTCRSGVMAVSDYQAGKVVATAAIGSGVDGAGYDAASGDAFASNADGTLTVLHQDGPDQYRVVQTLQTAPAARNMGLDPSNHRLFLVSAKFGPAPATGRGRGAVLPDTFTLMVVEREPTGR